MQWSSKPRVVEGVRWMKRSMKLTVARGCRMMAEELAKVQLEDG